MEGTVQISIKDFDELRERANEFEQKFKLLVKALSGCTVNVQEREEKLDEWIQIISIDAGKALKLIAQYGDGVEYIDENDILQFINIETAMIGTNE